MAEPSRQPSNSVSEKDSKTPNLVGRGKKEIEAAATATATATHSDSEKSPHHHKETHGTSDDIDEDTPVEEVKGPGVLQRVKEEIEAVVQAIHPKK